MNLTSTVEGTWNEVILISLTDEQKTLLASTASTDQDAKETLLKQITSNRLENVTDAATIAAASAAYTKLKPALSASDIYQLIACDVSLDDNLVVQNSILNCRVNGQHIQLRL